jgi:BirA family biotin operon repressor/biotin-[acetyl-CoA-carboxylase] ligase
MNDHFTQDSLRAALGARPFRFYHRVGSTQDLAREWALSEPPAPAGAVVIAEEQTAGRGRQGRPWYSPPQSSIMCSLILRPHLMPEQLQRLTMAIGIAVAETLSPFLPEAVTLKWPNDVLAQRKKIGGILTEAIWLDDRPVAMIVGIGINIRTDFAGTEMASYATSLEAELGRPVDRHVILANLLGHVYAWSERVDDPTLLTTWRTWLSTLGKRVTIFPPPDRSSAFQGVAESVDENGALFVRLDSGELRRVLAADVGLWEEG